MAGNSELKSVGLVFKADGATDFKSTLKDVSAALKENKTEFDKAKLSWDESTTTAQKLADTQKFLAEQTNIYGDKVSILKDRLADYKDQEKAAADAVQERVKHVDDLQKKMDELNKAEGDNAEAIAATQKELDKANQELDKAEKNYTKCHDAVRSGTQAVEDAELKQAKFTKELEKTNKQLEQESSNAKKAADSLKETSNKLKGISDTTGKIGDAMTKGVTVPIVAAGAASIAAFNEVDGAVDTVIKATGATGKAAEEMGDIVEDVATSIPVSFDEAAVAIGEVNTRFGTTGETLANMSRDFLKFSKITDADVGSSVDNAQKLIEAFNLSAEDTPALLDAIASESQASGISVDTLFSDLISNGAAFRELGMNIADSIDFLGAFEKSGVDVSTAMAGLKKAVAKSLKSGQPLSDIIASSFTEAETAIDLFGAKAGPTLYEAFKNGVISIEDFQAGTASLSDTMGAVTSTFEAMTDPTDEMLTVMNSLKVTGSEIATAMMPMIKDLVDILLPAVKDLSAAWGSLSPEMQSFIVQALAVAAAVGPIMTVVSKVTGGVSSLLDIGSKLIQGGGLISNMLSGIVTFISGPGGIVLGIAAVVAGIIWLYNNCEWFRNLVDGIFSWISTELPILIANVSEFCSNAWQYVKNFLDNVKQKGENLKSNINNFLSFIKSIPAKISEFLSKIKLPHFTLSGSLNPLDWIKTGAMPRIGLQWYAEGGILRRPTIFGMNGNNAMVGGEAGPEAVLPIEKLLTFMKSVNQEQSQQLVEAFSSVMFDSVKRAILAAAPAIMLDGDKVGEFVDTKLKEVLV